MKNFKFKILNLKTKNAGFTLVEILVVVSLMVYVSSVVIRNFSASRLNLERLANVMASDIRLAQQLALSSHQYQGPTDPAPRNRCGYGITKINGGGGESNTTECGDGLDNDSDTFVDSADPGCDQIYFIYTGPPTVDADGDPVSCGANNYQQSQDQPFYKSVILDKRVNFVDNPGFRDIFYEPPGPTTYIQNSSTPSNPADPATYYEKIYIKKVSLTKQNCDAGSKDCIFICVYLSGRVEVSKSPTCPAPF